MKDKPPAAVLAQAAAAAGFAPSVHNTQPWRWTVASGELDLFADRSRQLQVADPQGRLLAISCGAALHHVSVALASQGWQALIDLLPDPADPDHLARVRLAEHIGVQAEAMRHFQAMRLRHTDRRPTSDVPVPEAAIEAIRQAVTAQRGHLQVLSADEVLQLGSVSAQADRVEAMDPQQREEMAYWIGGRRDAGAGVPDTALLDSLSQSIVPGRDFVHYGTLPAGEGHDRTAAFTVLFGDGDEPADWLRAGMAMSAGWLAATELGVSVLPFSAVIEVAATRETLRRMLSGIGYPHLVLRFGAPDPQHGSGPHTPRLAAEQIIEITS